MGKYSRGGIRVVFRPADTADYCLSQSRISDVRARRVTYRAGLFRCLKCVPQIIRLDELTRCQIAQYPCLILRIESLVSPHESDGLVPKRSR